MKRKQPEADDAGPGGVPGSPTPRARRSARPRATVPDTLRDPEPSAQLKTPKKRRTAGASESTPATPATPTTPLSAMRTATPMPKINRVLFADATNGTGPVTPSRADRSARRKSAQILKQQDEDDLWDGGAELAEEILRAENEEEPDAVKKKAEPVTTPVRGKSRDRSQSKETAQSKESLGKKREPEMPKRRAGRPKGARNRRSPTPEGELPPHERYFFQNRPGPIQTSNNTMVKAPLLTHEEYAEYMANYVDPHAEAKEFLLELHERAFPQWAFELHESFNICLYGYGSKLELVRRFADYMYLRFPPEPRRIVMVNGFMQSLTPRGMLVTVVEAIFGRDHMPPRLGAQATEVLDVIANALATNPPPLPILVCVNSIDAPALRKPATQALLACLASFRGINMIATADTINFLLMWDVVLREQLNFVFHDGTTFAMRNVDELNVVDEVYALLGRRSKRLGGRDGINFVLKSLPENTRKLYRLLITELLTLAGDEVEGQGGDDEGAGAEDDEAANSGSHLTIELRMLYHRASEEFIASSELMFRTQLKEFYDHQMLEAHTTAAGTEMLSVPLTRNEMEGVLEDLVME